MTTKPITYKTRMKEKEKVIKPLQGFLEEARIRGPRYIPNDFEQRIIDSGENLSDEEFIKKYG